MSQIAWSDNKMRKENGVTTQFLSDVAIKKARTFHKSFPEYRETPLRSLKDMADFLGVGGIYIKDESYRFGLNAFKVLGGSFAIARHLAKCLQTDIDQLDYATLTSLEVCRKLGEITFVTATDGNHGRGVAWTARQLKQKAVVYMPKGSSPTRLANIRAEGATASIIDNNYDEAVRLAAEQARQHGWVVVQDTAWEGYEEIPVWIMQGYGTMAVEALEQLNRLGIEKPTHIFLQAGVGSLAGAVQGYFASMFGSDRPKSVIVEPNLADCLYRSVLANDGKPRFVDGDMATIMAGLACGEPNTIAWEVLRDYSDMFLSCPDWVAEKGMRMLGNPLGDDERIVSGESGAVTMGVLPALLNSDDMKPAREKLGLDKNSRILLFSTEGDTDPQRYRTIVWDGQYPCIEAKGA